MKQIIIPFSGGMDSTLLALQALDEIRALPAGERPTVTLSYIHSPNFTQHEHSKSAVLQIYQILKNWYSDLYVQSKLSLMMHGMDIGLPYVDNMHFQWKGYGGGTQCPFIVIAALGGMDVVNFSDIEIRIGYLSSGHNIEVSHRISDAILSMSRLINVKSKRRYLANIKCAFPLGNYSKEESILKFIKLLDKKESKGEVKSILPLIHAIVWCDHFPWGSHDECFYKVTGIRNYLKSHPDNKESFEKIYICQSCMTMLLDASKAYEQLTERQKEILLDMMSRGNSEVQDMLLKIVQDKDKEDIGSFLEVHPDMR